MNVVDYLAKEAAVVDQEMARIIPRDGKPAEVYGLVWDFLDRGGKRFRPALCFLSAEAVGGSRETALAAGVAVELFHNFTLIHDDIEDNSQMRRGKPCLHVTHGIPLAVNAGDGLFMMVNRAILGLPVTPARKLRTNEILLGWFTRVLEGQAIELGWHHRHDWNISDADYFRMVEGKTGALLAAACEAGAFLGGGRKRAQRALRDFGMAVGVAFQIQDDALNLVGSEEKYKKEIGGDITEGKRTLMVIHAINNPRVGAADKQRLVRLLDAHSADQAEIAWAIKLLCDAGAVAYAQTEASRRVKKAKVRLARVIAPNPASEKLFQLADFLINREY